MLKTSKIAISLPREDFQKIERIRKNLGIQRSTIIDKAIKYWLKGIEKEEMIRQYEEGYRRKPESIEEIKAQELASAQAFSKEEW